MKTIPVFHFPISRIVAEKDEDTTKAFAHIYCLAAMYNAPKLELPYS